MSLNRKNEQLVDFAILIPSFNQGSALEATLKWLEKELLHVGFSWEILVADNASTDASRDVLQRLESEITGLRVFIHEENIGFLRNLAFLATEAEGKFVVLLGCGDFLNADALGLVLKEALSRDVFSINVGVASHRNFKPSPFSREPRQPLALKQVGKLSINTPYQEAFCGNIFRNDMHQLATALGVPMKTGDTWPHIEVQLRALRRGEVILRTRHEIVSVYQSDEDWHTNSSLSTQIFILHVKLLLRHSYQSLGLLLKLLIITSSGTMSLLRQNLRNSRSSQR